MSTKYNITEKADLETACKTCITTLNKIRLLKSWSQALTIYEKITGSLSPLLEVTECVEHVFKVNSYCFYVNGFM